MIWESGSNSGQYSLSFLATWCLMESASCWDNWSRLLHRKRGKIEEVSRWSRHTLLHFFLLFLASKGKRAHGVENSFAVTIIILIIIIIIMIITKYLWSLLWKQFGCVNSTCPCSLPFVAVLNCQWRRELRKPQTGTPLLSRPRWMIFQILDCQLQRFFPSKHNDERLMDLKTG